MAIGTLSQNYTLVKQYVHIKLYTNLWFFFYENLIINIVHYVYIDSWYIYTPNQTISVAKLCFFLY